FISGKTDDEAADDDFVGGGEGFWCLHDDRVGLGHLEQSALAFGAFGDTVFRRRSPCTGRQDKRNESDNQNQTRHESHAETPRRGRGDPYASGGFALRQVNSPLL